MEVGVEGEIDQGAMGEEREGRQGKRGGKGERKRPIEEKWNIFRVCHLLSVYNLIISSNHCRKCIRTERSTYLTSPLCLAVQEHQKNISSPTSQDDSI